MLSEDIGITNASMSLKYGMSNVTEAFLLTSA